MALFIFTALFIVLTTLLRIHSLASVTLPQYAINTLTRDGMFGSGVDLLHLPRWPSLALAAVLIWRIHLVSHIQVERREAATSHSHWYCCVRAESLLSLFTSIV